MTKLELEPRIAESWEPNADGTEWTFKIRQGVTFHSGATLTANDVKTTFESLVDPKNASNALSALGGVLSPGNTEAPDDATVVFHLDAPNGNFPTLVEFGQLQRDHHPGRPRSGRLGEDIRRHGALQAREASRLRSARSSSATTRYWGEKANPDGFELKFYDEEGPMIARAPGRRGGLRRALLGLGRSRRS